MNLTKPQISDIQLLLQRPEFVRFLDFAVIQPASIFHAATNGSDGRNLVSEGRKELGFSILAMVEQGQPAQHPDGTPVLTLMQVLREKAQSTTTEKTDAKRNDRNAEILDGDDEPE